MFEQAPVVQMQIEFGVGWSVGSVSESGNSLACHPERQTALYKAAADLFRLLQPANGEI